MDNQGKLIVDC